MNSVSLNDLHEQTCGDFERTKSELVRLLAYPGFDTLDPENIIISGDKRLSALLQEKLRREPYFLLPNPYAFRNYAQAFEYVLNAWLSANNRIALNQLHGLIQGSDIRIKPKTEALLVHKAQHALNQDFFLMRLELCLTKENLHLISLLDFMPSDCYGLDAFSGLVYLFLKTHILDSMDAKGMVFLGSNITLHGTDRCLCVNRWQDKLVLSSLGPLADLKEYLVIYFKFICSPL